MWLLDANMDVHLILVLAQFRISADTALNRGWNDLTNGDLVAAAVDGGFECLLTRDQLFGQSASRSLERYPDFALVVVNLPQLRWQQYVQSFIRARNATPIVPVPGAIAHWP